MIIEVGDGYQQLYGHLLEGSIKVKVGDWVYMGAIIGRLGQSGNASNQPASEAHVHFGIQKDGHWIDPVSFLNNKCPWDK